MKKVVSFICCVFLLSHANAQNQNCDDAAIMNVKGIWKKRGDANMKTDKNQAQIINRIDAVSKLYQIAYPDPKAMEARWYRTMEGHPAISNGPTPYQFNSLYLAWYCNENLHNLMLGGETGTWSLVYVNSFGLFMTNQYDKAALTVEGAQAWVLPKKIGEWKGLLLYEPSASSKGNKAVLITRNNQLPYKPVTRLQFLLSLKEKIESEKNLQLDLDKKQLVRSDAEEADAKQKGLENIVKYNQPQYVEQRKVSYLKNYKTDAQRKEESIQRTEQYFNNRLKPVTDELNKESNADLQQPAIVNDDYNSIFKGFTTDEKGGRMIVLIDTTYFDLTLPRYVPQLIVLYWSWDKNSPCQNFKTQFEENFPVDKLKAMIDK